MPMPRIPPGLKYFWAAVVTVVLAGAAVLQILGPMKPRPVLAARTGNAIPAPSPILLAAAGPDGQWRIPHPSSYGVMPMRYYAARATVAAGVPRIAIMVGGIGYALAPSLAAVRDLPPAVSLAFSPYAGHDAAIARAARAAGHETLMGLPMQVNGEPDITAGDQALRAGSAPAHNLRRLDWALSRETGYAGVTDAIGLTAPETFLAHPREAAWLAGQLAGDGLFLVVAAPGIAAPGHVNGRAADVTIDPSEGVAAETRALDGLIATARAKGSAFGVLIRPHQPAIAALAAWCKTLAAAHVALVPVSALATAPP